jgi:hypothetical protein
VPSSSVYIGINVACAIGKRLPICVVSALPAERRRAFGDAQRPDDSIWVPL